MISIVILLFWIELDLEECPIMFLLYNKCLSHFQWNPRKYQELSPYHHIFHTLSSVTLGQLSDEVEQLESSCSQYQVQAVAMDQGTMETRDNVRRAEEELASVRGEVTRVVANWTNTVININKVNIHIRVYWISKKFPILMFSGIFG